MKVATSNEVKARILAICKLCLDLNDCTEHTVFYDLQAHCSLVSVRIHIDGWISGESANHSFNAWYDLSASRTEKSVIEELEKIKRNLVNICLFNGQELSK